MKPDIKIETTIDADSLKYFLSMPKGRKVIWDILAAAGLFHQPMIFGDDSRTAFNCGRLNQGLILWADCLTVDPDHTAMMIKEQGNVDNSLVRNASKRDAASEPRKPTGQRTDPDDNSGPGPGELPAGLGLDRSTGRPIDPADPAWRGGE